MTVKLRLFDQPLFKSKPNKGSRLTASNSATKKRFKTGAMACIPATMITRLAKMSKGRVLIFFIDFQPYFTGFSYLLLLSPTLGLFYDVPYCAHRVVELDGNIFQVLTAPCSSVLPDCG
jgi:hypothetical protein